MVGLAGLEELVAQLFGADVVCAHEPLAADVADVFRELGLELLEAVVERGACDVRHIVEYLFVAVDFEVSLRAHHVDDGAAPGGVQAARNLEAVVLDFVDARARDDAAYLRLFAEGEEVRLDGRVVLPCPHLARDAHAALHLVEDEEHFVLVAYLTQLLEELGAEVVVAAFALYRLDDDRGYAVGVVHQRVLDLLYRLRLEPLDLAEVLLEREGYLRVDDARPLGEFRVALMLVRVVGVRDGERVAAASVEGLVEVHYLRAPASVEGLAGRDFALLDELLHLPVHRDLEGVLDGERAVVDEEHVVVTLGHSDLAEGLDEVSHLLRVDVGVRDLVDCGAEYLLLEFLVVELRVVHAEGRGGEEGVEVEPVRSCDGVDDVAAL